MSYRLRASVLVLAASSPWLGCSVDVTGRNGTLGRFDGTAQGDGSSIVGRDAAAEPDGGTSPSFEADAKTFADADTQPGEQPDPRDAIVGSYAERRSFATIQSINTSIFSNDVNVLTTSYSLAEIRREGQDYVLRESACRVVTDSSGDFFTKIDVKIDDTVPRSMPSIDSVLEVSFAGDRLLWKRPLRGVPVGWLAKNESDLLPASPDDKRIRDTDGDGNPGVTAHVSARVGLKVDGDIYMVQWNRARYEGERDAEQRLVGENFDMSEQHVIGASVSVLATDPPVRPDPDTSRNRVMLTRLASPLDCDAMVAQIDALFPPLETP